MQTVTKVRYGSKAPLINWQHLADSFLSEKAPIDPKPPLMICGTGQQLHQVRCAKDGIAGLLLAHFCSLRHPAHPSGRRRQSLLPMRSRCGFLRTSVSLKAVGRYAESAGIRAPSTL
jgi:hypothetical protein